MQNYLGRLVNYTKQKFQRPVEALPPIGFVMLAFREYQREQVLAVPIAGCPYQLVHLSLFSKQGVVGFGPDILPARSRR